MVVDFWLSPERIRQREMDYFEWEEASYWRGYQMKEMRTRGKVSAVDRLNSLIWLKRHNCYWTRTPEDRYGNREHRRKLIERWAGERLV